MRKGLTLIEMLVVLMVLAVLTLIAVPSFKTMITRSKFKEVGNLIQLAKAGTKYYDLKYGLESLGTGDQAGMWAVLKVDVPEGAKCVYTIVDKDNDPDNGTQAQLQVDSSGSTLYTYDLPNGPGVITEGHPDAKYIEYLEED